MLDLRLWFDAHCEAELLSQPSNLALLEPIFNFVVGPPSPGGPGGGSGRSFSFENQEVWGRFRPGSGVSYIINSHVGFKRS